MEKWWRWFYEKGFKAKAMQFWKREMARMENETKYNQEHESVLYNQERQRNMLHRGWGGECWEGFLLHRPSSRLLLKPLEAGYLSYYVIRLAQTSNESCGYLSALWIAPSPSAIYQVAAHLAQTHPPPLTRTYTSKRWANCTPVWMGWQKWIQPTMGFQC